MVVSRNIVSLILAQGVTSCRKPKLDEGYFNSEENVYNEGTTLYYGCNKGRKPVAEGWWGITVCKNSQWTPEPQCIDESDCVAPDNPNAKVRKPSEEGWYKNGRSVNFECDEFYETKRTNAKCENGIWEDLPVCEKRKDLCGEPPQVKNAVITQEYRDTFLDSSSVQYKCQDSYNLNITDPTICISGIWSGIPKCKNKNIDLTKSGSEQRSNEHCICFSVDKCGEKPVVDNGDYISDDTRMALTYKCNLYYKLEGPEKVMCHSNGVWSETPVCKEPCTVSPTSFDLLDATTNQYVMDGGSSVFLCKQKGYYGTRYFSHFHCQNGKVTHKPCTRKYDVPNT
uniref:Sushi domain-containing protein n=1 Tax=Esox lucius TaxID=8010 RepID=A0A6Q2X9T1_ESOLU